MSRNEIAKMSVEERVALMEELWSSFDRDGIEYPAPAWHEKILDERANSKDEDFLPLDDVKKYLQSKLNDD
jgi:putative addiction module component (TIGR02574 family)